MAQTARLHRKALRLEWLTTLWNVVEAIIAVGSGVVSGSAALLAFGLDSMIEVSSAVAVLWRLLKAGPEATLEESQLADRRAHLIVGITFFLLAGYVTVDASLALVNREAPANSPVGLALAVASLISMPTLAYSKGRIGRQMGSKALQADALETWLCAYLSGSLLLGLGLNAWLGWWWADPVAAIVMVPFMLWQGRSAVLEARSDGGITMKPELMAEIESAWNNLQAYLAELTDEQMTALRDHAGWSVKDHLAHLVAWEESIAALFEDRPRHAALGIDEALFSGGSFDAMNAAIREQRKDLPLGQVIAELHSTHERLLKWLRPLSDEELMQPAGSFFASAQESDDRSVAELILDNTADHFSEHLGWIKALREGHS